MKKLDQKIGKKIRKDQKMENKNRLRKLDQKNSTVKKEEEEKKGADR